MLSYQKGGSSNGNIFRVNGPLCGEFTGEIPSQKPVTRSFDVFFDLCLNKQLSKQSEGWWFETPSGSLWRHCDVWPSARQSNHARPFFKGDNGHDPRDWVSGLSSANRHYVQHDYAFWVDGCGVPFVNRRVAFPQGDLVSFLHPSRDHSPIIALHAMQIRSGLGPSFACMEHGVPDPRKVNSSSRYERGVGMDKSWLILPHATRHHLMKASTQPPLQDKQSLRFANAVPKSLSFHARLPEDQLLLHFLRRFRDDDQWPLLLTRFNFNPSIDK